MSVHHQIEVTCPACQAKGPYTVWSSVNSERDPEAMHDLAEGRLLAYACSACGESSPVVYPVLLHAMKESEMVQLVGEKDPMPSTIPGVSAPLMERYTHWVVRSQNDLMECARLYEAGLDRFAMLMLRLRLVLAPAREKKPVHKAVHFMGVENEEGEDRLLFVIITHDDEQLQIFVDRTTWDQHVATVRDARAKCVPYGKWTAWDNKTAMASYDIIAAANGAPPTLN